MNLKIRAFLVIFLVFVVSVGAAAFSFPEYANEKLESINPNFSVIPVVPFKLGLDLQGGLHLVYEADLSSTNPSDHDSAMQGLRDVIERRVNFFGVAEPVVQTQGKGETRRLIVELAGIQDPNEAIRLIGQTPFLEFREYKEGYEDILARNTEIFESGEGELENPFSPTQLTGRYLERAEIGFDSLIQEPLINLQFDREGAELFKEITARNIGRPLAIFLDNQLLQAPIVQAEISGGKAQITGSYTIEEAQMIARNLNTGALPVPITLLSQQSVGATLGTVSLQKSLEAGIIGLLLVGLFMLLIYRLPGLIAVFALLFYIILILALFKLISITFTLAGIAGLILSLGMAVDANILIFSRMREELAEKKSFAVALEEGFRRAWPSIRDGNITTLVVAIILFSFGSSFVQGFAITLSLGILMSMFSAIFITRNMLRMFQNTKISRVSFLWK